jgi:MOSC domain-containing protein YiiM
MKIISVNVGRPRLVEWRGHMITTSIWKAPVEGRLRVGRENIAGDEQSDLTVHGGANKAVYVYPGEHYAYWSEQLPDMALPWGAFGENLTTEGLLEDNVMIGDRLRAGSAEFVVTQPRLPCFKLGIRFGSERMIARFLRSARSGFYLAVAREGEIGPGDAIENLGRAGSLSIADAFAQQLVRH